MKLPNSHVNFCNMLYNCIDLSDCNGLTLLQVISLETGKSFIELSDLIVENWLKGLPSSCTIPFYDDEIENILQACGNSHWTVDDYWRFAGNRVLTFAKHPKIYL